jgi:hypothetical protein
MYVSNVAETSYKTDIKHIQIKSYLFVTDTQRDVYPRSYTTNVSNTELPNNVATMHTLQGSCSTGDRVYLLAQSLERTAGPSEVCRLNMFIIC